MIESLLDALQSPIRHSIQPRIPSSGESFAKNDFDANCDVARDQWEFERFRFMIPAQFMLSVRAVVDGACRLETQTNPFVSERFAPRESVFHHIHTTLNEEFFMRAFIRFSCAITLLSFVASATAPVSADDAADAKAIIDKAITAFGGVDAVKKQSNSQWSDTGTYHGMGDPIQYQGKYSMSLPSKSRMEIVGVFMIIIDGDKAWMKTSDGVMELGADDVKEQKQVLHVGYITSFVPFAKGEEGYKFSLAGDADIDGEACVGVNCERDGFRSVKMEFSKKTNLLMRATYQVKASEQGNKEVSEEAYYRNWKKEDGVMSPRKMVINRDGKKYVESEPTKIEYLETIDAGVFAKPAA